jgi:pimeloyl-ACP methyl ester carboxylesterase
MLTLMTMASAAGAAGEAAAAPKSPTKTPKAPTRAAPPHGLIEARDGAALSYRSWGQGRPILFVAAWGMTSQAWQYQMAPLSEQGFRCIAFDRRGHGKSQDPGEGYDMDTLASDLAEVIDQLDLTDLTLVGHSLGAAECVRYLTRHGAGRVRRLVLVAPTTPYLAKATDNPDGQDPSVPKAMRAAFRTDFPGIVAANIRPFVDAQTSQAMVDWIVAMMASTSLQALIECNRALSVADFRAELPKITVPTLILQGDADVSAPIDLTGRKTAALIPGSRLEVYAGAPHGLIYTHMARVNADLAAFAAG